MHTQIKGEKKRRAVVCEKFLYHTTIEYHRIHTVKRTERIFFFFLSFSRGMKRRR
jgi:hypothetical protein